VKKALTAERQVAEGQTEATRVALLAFSLVFCKTNVRPFEEYVIKNVHIK